MSGPVDPKSVGPGLLEGARPRLRWLEPEPLSAEEVRRLSASLRLPADLCEVLVRRGYGDPAAARAFLRPDPRSLHPPQALPDGEAAAERIERAVRTGERILVHGDYDADGLSGAALLTRGLRELGATVDAFVPHRTRDGYDLGEEGIRRAAAAKAALVVTVDCGVSAIGAVRRARERGIDVVVTDHHRPPPELPDALAVVNPNRADSAYPFRGLAGVGVAFKLLAMLYARAGVEEERLNQHLDLVALGTVADQAPLVDENRVLVRMGLRALHRSRKPGVRALLERVGLEGVEEPTARDVAFRLGPRLNAAGRIGSPDHALKLLLTDDPREAVRLAEHLELQNRRRRAADRRVVAEAEEKLRESFVPDRDRVVVLWEEGWPIGVLGLAASRLAERLHRPTVLLSFDGEHGRGSARSVEGFHLFRALESCAELLDRFGGHRMAAGLDIRRACLEAFVARLQSHAREVLDREELEPCLRIDLAVALESADRELHRRLAYLAPFGEENRRPILLVHRVSLDAPRTVGEEGRHLRVTLADGSARLPAVGFRLGHRHEEIRATERWDVAFELHDELWRGRRSLAAHLIDLRPASP